MSVLESLNEDSYGGSIIGKITSLSFSLKTVDVLGKEFFLFLLYFHKMAYGSVNIRVGDFLIAISH